MIESIKIIEFFNYATELKASDIHLYTGSFPMYRLHGKLYRAEEYGITTKDEVRQLIFNITDDFLKARFFSENLDDIDFSVDIPGAGRFRVNVFRCSAGDALVFRVIPSRIPTMEELGLPPSVEEMIRTRHSGLVLVTGKAGHGKTTTISAMLEYINKEFPYNIIMIEDPIEFVFEPKRSHISQRQVGEHANSFEQAIKSSLREDPDVIVIGEIRDFATASMTIQAAETGPLVISTLHTRSAVETIGRFVNFFPEDHRLNIRFLLADCMQGIISQTLVPKIDRTGRVLATEIMMGTTAISTLIREDKSQLMYSTIETGAKDGMQTLDFNLKNLMEANIIDPKDAFRYCNDKKRFLYYLDKM
ncbi:MAG TPA: PilT/PilU family type 4a pilus ATPase [Candidatus Eremiobacteraeota bacterium]|nr:MAG: Twitching mobility protein [bacterium ADurb.Bin363]HPZ07117.1 PilT/PilU family type 4a pilus ATPase [Candidatus Eremiobacteraeota bacterium]